MLTGDIFISYRHDDTAGYAGRIYDRLNACFRNRVFMDVANISLGEDFVDSIERHITSCSVFIALIGKQWATMTDEQGRRRLDQREDFVRIEVSSAIRHSITLIPVLIRGAKMPDPETLPGDIAAICRRNALQITESNFEEDMQRLIGRLNEIGVETSQADKHRESWRERFGRLPFIVGTAVLGLLLVVATGMFLRSYTGKSYATNASNVNTDGRQPDRNSETEKPVNSNDERLPPPNSAFFENSIENLDGDLAQHYVDFSFYYPRLWRRDRGAGIPGARNFVKVERSLPGERTQESFAVGWYSSESDLDVHRVAQELSSQFSKTFNEYRKISEGLTKVGIYTGYEFRFESIARNADRGRDIQI